MLQKYPTESTKERSVDETVDIKKSTEKNLDTKNQKIESRRDKVKYPALKKEYMLKLRSDYIETEYINGVRNSNGELVIRPLNEKEKEWLNKFYEETVAANFQHNKELRKAKKELRELLTKENPTKGDYDKLMELQMEVLFLEGEHLLYQDEAERKKIYNENNARNRCLLNNKKRIAYLKELNEEIYEDIHNDLYNQNEFCNLAEEVDDFEIMKKIIEDLEI